MKKITVGFYNEVFDNLKSRASGKGISLNSYIRDLVDIGVKVEDASTKKEGKKDQDLLTKMVETSLLNTQEMLYLNRYIAENVTRKGASDFKETGEFFKNKALGFLEALKS